MRMKDPLLAVEKTVERVYAAKPPHLTDDDVTRLRGAAPLSERL